MPEHLTAQIVVIVTGLLSLAALAVILSKQANTVGVIGAGASGLAQDIGAAVSPITGSQNFGGYTGGSYG